MPNPGIGWLGTHTLFLEGNSKDVAVAQRTTELNARCQDASSM